MTGNYFTVTYTNDATNGQAYDCNGSIKRCPHKLAYQQGTATNRSERPISEMSISVLLERRERLSVNTNPGGQNGTLSGYLRRAERHAHRLSSDHC
jgi:hypothetical protein